MLTEETMSKRGSTSSPQTILRTLRRRMWLIALVAVVITASALGFSLYQTPTYEASVKILVGQNSTSATSLSGSVEGLQEVALTVAKAVPTVPVAEAVVERVDLPEVSTEEVLENMSAQQDPGTMFIDVSYKNPDPERTQLVANTIGQVTTEKISQVSPGASAMTATVWEPATLPNTPVSPDLIRNSILAFVLGTLLGVVLAFLLEYVDDSWDSPEEVEEVSGVPTFGVIPAFSVAASRKAEVLANKGDEQ